MNASRPIRVLLVEDDAQDAELLQELLQEDTSPAFEIERADRLRAALDRITQGGTDVVLLDLSLPDSRGLDTFLKLRAQAPAIPVVILTGFDNDAFAVEALANGAQD